MSCPDSSPSCRPDGVVPAVASLEGADTALAAGSALMVCRNAVGVDVRRHRGMRGDQWVVSMTVAVLLTCAEGTFGVAGRLTAEGPLGPTHPSCLTQREGGPCANASRLGPTIPAAPVQSPAPAREIGWGARLREDDVGVHAMDDHAGDLARDLPETALHVALQCLTSQPSTRPPSCANVWSRGVLLGVVNHPRIDGEDEVAG